MGLLNWTSAPHYQARSVDSPEIIHNLGWNLDPASLEYVQDHWLMYPEPDKSLHLLLGMIYVVFFIASIIGNGTVLWIFGTAKSLRTPSNLFVLNLALCDLIMMMKMPIFLYNSFHYGMALGPLGCKLFAAGGTISGIGQGLSNACIAYDRYNTITRPFDGKLTRPKAALMVFMIWIWTMPWTLLPYMEVWGKFGAEGYLTACTIDFLDRSFDTVLLVTTMFIVLYVFPMSLILFYYSQIVSKVFSHEKALREQAKKMNVDSLRANQQNAESAEIRIAKAAITICFMYIISWTPYATIAMVGIWGDQSLITPGVSMIPALNCKMIACIDPYIYAISHPKFRVELQKRMPWLAINEKEEVSDTKSTTTENTQATQQT